MGLPIIGKLLGHRNPATIALYSHLADNPLHEAADQISSGQLVASLNGTAAKADSEVLIAYLIAQAGAQPLKTSLTS